MTSLAKIAFPLGFALLASAAQAQIPAGPGQLPGTLPPAPAVLPPPPPVAPPQVPPAVTSPLTQPTYGVPRGVTAPVYGSGTIRGTIYTGAPRKNRPNAKRRYRGTAN